MECLVFEHIDNDLCSQKMAILTFVLLLISTTPTFCLIGDADSECLECGQANYPATVFDLLSSHNFMQQKIERLVIILYRVNGHIQLYIPNRLKQMATHDLVFDDTDFLQPLRFKFLDELFVNNPYVYSPGVDNDDYDVNSNDAVNFRKQLMLRLHLLESPISFDLAPTESAGKYIFHSQSNPSSEESSESSETVHRALQTMNREQKEVPGSDSGETSFRSALLLKKIFGVPKLHPLLHSANVKLHSWLHDSDDDIEKNADLLTNTNLDIYDLGSGVNIGQTVEDEDKPKIIKILKQQNKQTVEDDYKPKIIKIIKQQNNDRNNKYQPYPSHQQQEIYYRPEITNKEEDDVYNIKPLNPWQDSAAQSSNNIHLHHIHKHYRPNQNGQTIIYEYHLPPIREVGEESSERHQPFTNNFIDWFRTQFQTLDVDNNHYKPLLQRVVHLFRENNIIIHDDGTVLDKGSRCHINEYNLQKMTVSKPLVKNGVYYQSYILTKGSPPVVIGYIPIIEDSNYRIIGGKPATGSGTPLNNKARNGWIS